MCTLLVAHGLRRDFPLVLAANRDEFFARAATPPTLDRSGPIPFLAGRDTLARGTWLGVNARGLFAGLTNQRAPAGPDAPASRGEVVQTLLQHARSVDDAEAYLGALDPARYRPFNLLFGTAEALAVAYVRPDPASVTVARLGPGVHVLANDVLGSTRFPKAPRTAGLVPEAVLREAPWPHLADALQRALGDHGLPPQEALPPPDPWLPTEYAAPLQSLCVHLPHYGTVSAAVIALAPAGLAHFRHAEGAPCVTPFVERFGGW